MSCKSHKVTTDMCSDCLFNVCTDLARMREALFDIVNQFASEGPKGIGTGGLSALENAFDVLDIPEPIKREDFWKKQEEALKSAGDGKSKEKEK